MGPLHAGLKANEPLEWHVSLALEDSRICLSTVVPEDKPLLWEHSFPLANIMSQAQQL